MNTKIDIKEGLKNFLIDLRSYFNVSDDLESQADVEASIRSGVSFKGSQLLTLIFAIFIASLGLNTDSIPVIIGAMLISPLMGPIIGMGLGIGIQDYDLLKRGSKNIIAAVLGSLITSALYFLISPQYEGASQLLARTSPSIYDVFVALFGGAAGILSIAAKNKGQVLPGVAIATSLMPPLCTAGYGIATWQMHFFFGALYLFFTNMVFILVATWIGVKLFRFKSVVYQNEKRAKRVKYIVYTVVGATICVSTYLTVVMLQKNIFLEKAQAFVENEMVFPNTQVLNHKESFERGKRIIDVTLIGESLPKDSLQLVMMTKLDSLGLGGTTLNIRQGFSMATTGIDKIQNEDKFYELMQNELNSKQTVIDSLRGILAVHKQFSDESVSVSPEIKVLFPTVRDIALSHMVVSSVETAVSDTVNMIFVNAPGGLGTSDRTKLREYLEVRLKKNNIYLTVNPSTFPWPSKTANGLQ
ncbi:MAG: TIGR00341 family protein [Muribaculaceae bacterium]|nr:TIGR00341 family protein [Muribaculaceae bacterium]